MRYQVRFAPAAAEDSQRLFDFLAEQDLAAAERARAVVGQAILEAIFVMGGQYP